MKIANLYIVHKNPEQVLRLVTAMAHPEMSHFIHVDGKCDLNSYKALLNLPQVHFIKNRIKVTWGGNGLLLATLSGMEEITKIDGNFSYINVMSGQDYPIKPINHFYDFVFRNKGTEFIDFRSRDRFWNDDVLYRVRKYSMINWGFRGKYRLEQWINRMTPDRKFPYEEVNFGSNWFTITVDCAAHSIEQSKINKRLLAFYYYVWSADEFFFQNVVFNSEYFKKVKFGNLRYLDWSHHLANPKTLGVDDLSKMVDSGHFLARKFDMAVDAEVLDLLDQHRSAIR